MKARGKPHMRRPSTGSFSRLPALPNSASVSELEGKIPGYHVIRSYAEQAWVEKMRGDLNVDAEKVRAEHMVAFERAQQQKRFEAYTVAMQRDISKLKLELQQKEQENEQDRTSVEATKALLRLELEEKIKASEKRITQEAEEQKNEIVSKYSAELERLSDYMEEEIEKAVEERLLHREDEIRDEMNRAFDVRYNILEESYNESVKEIEDKYCQRLSRLSHNDGHKTVLFAHDMQEMAALRRSVDDLTLRATRAEKLLLERNGKISSFTESVSHLQVLVGRILQHRRTLPEVISVKLNELQSFASRIIVGDPKASDGDAVGTNESNESVQVLSQRSSRGNVDSPSSLSRYSQRDFSEEAEGHAGT